MSFSSAITGLNAAAADLNVKSNNIANVNTTGLKDREQSLQMCTLFRHLAPAIPTSVMVWCLIMLPSSSLKVI